MGPLAELLAAFCLLTRFPLSRLLRGREPAPIGRAIWAFPLAGAVVAALGAAAYGLCVRLGMTPVLAAFWSLATMLLLTGALHEDGLADTADGFGGGWTPERKLEIMRDSRIGSFGAIALVLSLLMRGAAIAALADPSRVLPALVASAACGRAAMVVPLLALRAARPDGLAAGMRALPRGRAGLAFAAAALFAILLLPSWAALRAGAGACAGALVMTWAAKRQIGGYTGDILGATAVVAETLAICLVSGAGGGR